jgi:hypothetical protein
LATLNVPNPLQDPQIELVETDNTTDLPTIRFVGNNDSWRTIDDDSPANPSLPPVPLNERVALEEELDGAGFAPTQNLESVLWPTLRPGIYSARLSGAGNSTGIGLIEFYEY